MEVNIAQQFSDTPGARYKTDGPKSGEEFRETLLEPYFIGKDDTTIVRVYLDGTKGYAPSFLEEAFGGLVRKFGKTRVKMKLQIYATQMEFFKEKSERYIEEAG